MQVGLSAGQGFVPEPEGDHGDVGPGEQKLHRGGMPESVNGDVLGGQGRASGGRPPVVELDAPFNGVAGQPLPGRAGEQRAGGLSVAFGEPGFHDPDGGGKQRRVAFLPAFSCAVDVRPGLDPDAVAGQAGELGDSQAGLDGEGEHGVVAPAGPGFLVAGSEERVGLVRGEVGDVGAVAALAGDGQDPLDQRAVLGMAQGGVGEERVDCRQAGVAGPDAVAAIVLQVLQERGDGRGVEVGETERARRFPRSGGGEADQQPERVAVGGDRGGAGVPLADQPAGEELLQDGSEVTHRCPLSRRPGRRRAASAQEQPRYTRMSLRGSCGRGIPTGPASARRRLRRTGTTPAAY